MRIMQIADNKGWIMTGSVLKKMKETTRIAPPGVLSEIGLKNQHSYTVVDVREVVMDNGELDYLVFLRNPTGNFFNKDAEVWQGDWSRTSSKWTPKLRDQCHYYVTEETMAEAKLQAKLEL
jgi:hypothetical protein